jgi:hypothetical protein
MSSGLNAFEISDIREEKTDAVLTGRSGYNNVTIALKNGWTEFLPSTICGYRRNAISSLGGKGT